MVALRGRESRAFLSFHPKTTWWETCSHLIRRGGMKKIYVSCAIIAVFVLYYLFIVLMLFSFEVDSDVTSALVNEEAVHFSVGM